MKTVSIRELHARTDELVRASQNGRIVITERGRPIALLKAVETADLAGAPFPKRDRSKMPAATSDSTAYVSEDRDER
jgi:prevent-host-death family protein